MRIISRSVIVRRLETGNGLKEKGGKQRVYSVEYSEYRADERDYSV